MRVGERRVERLERGIGMTEGRRRAGARIRRNVKRREEGRVGVRWSGCEHTPLPARRRGQRGIPLASLETERTRAARIIRCEWEEGEGGRKGGKKGRAAGRQEVR